MYIVKHRHTFSDAHHGPFSFLAWHIYNFELNFILYYMNGIVHSDFLLLSSMQFNLRHTMQPKCSHPFPFSMWLRARIHNISNIYVMLFVIRVRLYLCCYFSAWRRLRLFGALHKPYKNSKLNANITNTCTYVHDEWIWYMFRFVELIIVSATIHELFSGIYEHFHAVGSVIW